MFEKEAEEYVGKIWHDVNNWGGKEPEERFYNEIKFKQAYLAGAEFGYNKANEWHFVKDGLPKTSGKYLVYTGGEPFILDFATEVNSFGYWVVSLGDDRGVQDEDFETVKDRGEDDVIAWKEIILPELEIEND